MGGNIGSRVLLGLDVPVWSCVYSLYDSFSHYLTPSHRPENILAFFYLRNTGLKICFESPSSSSHPLESTLLMFNPAMCVHEDESPYAAMSQWGKGRAFHQVWHVPQNQIHHVFLDLSSGSRGYVAGTCNASGEEEELFSTSSHTQPLSTPFSKALRLEAEWSDSTFLRSTKPQMCCQMTGLKDIQLIFLCQNV